ncbi:MAG TPA: hypothetical protein VFH45_08600 [Acidimicrobiales bacterium]|nr:hypothetical protein [Acidimicrobiales bacterium]
MQRWIAPVVEVVVWAALLVGVWTVTLSSVATSEMLAAAGSALLCGVAVTAARRAMGAAWRPSAGWLRWFARLPLVVPADTFRVTAVAANRVGRRLTGHPDPGRGDRTGLRQVQLDRRGTEATRAARRALATLAVSLTPATYAVDVDEDTDRLVVHSLTGDRSTTEDAVSA